MADSMIQIEPGTRFKGYTIVSFIGKGASGHVYLAKKRILPGVYRFYAIKILEGSEDVLKKVKEHEGKNWLHIPQHPNIVGLIAIVTDKTNGRIGLVMDYIEGGTLSKYRGDKAMEPVDALKVTAGILRGLAHVHKRDILHRDLKPANILMSDETPMITDFGISRSISDPSSGWRGTAEYMAPEAFNDVRDKSIDIWSVNVILYQLLTGRYPFNEPDLVEKIKSISPESDLSFCSERVRKCVFRGFEKDPARRYPTAADLLAEVRACRRALLGLPPPPEPTPSIGARVSGWMRGRLKVRSVGLSLPKKPSEQQLGVLEGSINDLEQVIIIAHQIEEPKGALLDGVKKNFARHVKYHFWVSPTNYEDQLKGYYDIFKGYEWAIARRSDLVDIQPLTTDWEDFPYIFYIYRKGSEEGTFGYRGSERQEGIAAKYTFLDERFSRNYLKPYRTPKLKDEVSEAGDTERLSNVYKAKFGS